MSIQARTLDWDQLRAWWRPSSGRAGKIAYILLQTADLVLTLVAAHWGIREVNPFMRGLLAAPFPLIMVKAVIPLFLAWLVPGRLLVPASIFLCWVVGWNIKELVVFLS